ncbi:MAG TPA: helix-hairpin-helix domain-containing protein [Lacipirellulaceae bacterium]|nr:helix-hairpin-helix domain-containing protein [Lacipirellulaceae bacterium]
MKFSLIWRAQTLAAVAAAFMFVGLQERCVAAESKAAATVDLNKATEAQLAEVPGIGEAYAKKIVKSRPYKTLADLSKAGIPDATITKIRSKVSVVAEKEKAPAKSDKPTTDWKNTPVDVNKATESQLETVPGIGAATAKKIVKGRPYKSLDDLSKAGLSTSTIGKIRSYLSVSADAMPAKETKPATAETKPAITEKKPTVDAKSTKPATADTKPAMVDLNKATEKQLEDVPGIGAAYAKKIMTDRPYKTVEELSKAGLPAATVTKIKPLVMVADTPVPHTVSKPVDAEGTSKLPDLNKASEEELKDVPGIGDVYAKKIVEGRPYKKIDDLATAGIPAATITKIKSLVTIGAIPAPPVKGMVWVNLDSKKYHKESSRWYGTTKSGKYMSEADAIKAGYTSSKR